MGEKRFLMLFGKKASIGRIDMNYEGFIRWLRRWYTLRQ